MTTKDRSYEVMFGKQPISFRLEFRERERMAINVHPNRMVTVVAPLGRTVDEVIDRVGRRAGWIAKQQRHFAQFHPLTPPRRFIAGETHFYLGRQYRLKLVQDVAGKVRMAGRYLWVHVPDPGDTNSVEALLEIWYRDHARPMFARRLAECLRSARSLNVAHPELIVRKMKKRWGSCTKEGRILLNTELVKTPPYCIEYVIMHELCHVKVHDHSPEFYRLLSRIMPDWERRKRRLETFVL